MRRKRVIVRFRAGTPGAKALLKHSRTRMRTKPSSTSSSSAGRSDGRAFSDDTEAMLLLEGVNTGEARRLVDQDPFVKNQVFVLNDIREWTIFVDRLTTR